MPVHDDEGSASGAPPPPPPPQPAATSAKSATTNPARSTPFFLRLKLFLLRGETAHPAPRRARPVRGESVEAWAVQCRACGRRLYDSRRAEVAELADAADSK